MELVSVNILNFHQETFLRGCISSLVSQTHKNLEITVTDNGSSVNGLDKIRGEWPNLKIIKNDRNKGYSIAHNEFIRGSKGTFILLLNTDIILENNFIEEMLKAITEDKNIGMLQGKLYRMNKDEGRYKIFDSIGTVLYKTRRNLDRAFGEIDTGQYSNKSYVFGASGAAFFCRRQMLDDIKIDNEFFDEDFFAYREEVDLAWRAQLAGWRCAYIPTAIAYHYRLYSPDRRKKMSRELRQLQYRNRYLMLIKNEILLLFILHLPFILFFEIFSFLYVVFCEPFLIQTWPKIIKLLPKMLKKRQQIMQAKRISINYLLSIIK